VSSEGTAIRDYVHVTDLADAHVTSLRRLLENGGGGIFNLGTGRGLSVKQVVDAIAAETGEQLTISLGPRRPGDPAILVADASLAASGLGFKPQRSDLKTIIATAWSWHRKAHSKRERAGSFSGSLQGASRQRPKSVAGL
jgi:UDP-arabinose 4-epimerase